VKRAKLEKKEKKKEKKEKSVIRQITHYELFRHVN
jgi:hypothetical protein